MRFKLDLLFIPKERNQCRTKREHQPELKLQPKINRTININWLKKIKSIKNPLKETNE